MKEKYEKGRKITNRLYVKCQKDRETDRKRGKGKREKRQENGREFTTKIVKEREIK